MSVTLKDVAALAGVSPSTASRVCKNHPSISRETKEKVRKAMEQLGYEPSVQSSGPEAVSRTIGIILPPSPKESFENSFHLEVIRGISQFCNQHGYINTVITGQDEAEILLALTNIAKSGQIDGYIVTYSKQDDPIIDYLYSEGLLYIVIGKAHRFANQTVYVDNDNVLAGQEAAEYLLAKGHTNIAYLGSDGNLMFSADRRTGYQLALLNSGIAVDPENIVELPFIPEENLASVQALLQKEDRPTAILVSDDLFAVALERVCIEMGIRIPDDLSIISFNNSLFARITSPPLTSIDINSVQLGIEAASQVINHIENPNLLATKIIVPHKLVERNSCINR
ncbi:MAG: LacI family DNA-binding transcriptional regulator [Oscillospiraceae bacterium]|nr:LacI family DNA-binding transcriptional regulator [Oscillospiraceae bacterium]